MRAAWGLVGALALAACAPAEPPPRVEPSLGALAPMLASRSPSELRDLAREALLAGLLSSPRPSLTPERGLRASERAALEASGDEPDVDVVLRAVLTRAPLSRELAATLGKRSKAVRQGVLTLLERGEAPILDELVLALLDDPGLLPRSRVPERALFTRVPDYAGSEPRVHPALALAAASGREALLRDVARDRARPSPHPEWLERIECRRARCRELRTALASPRLVALALLGDLELARALADDPTEQPFVRDVAYRFAHAGPFSERELATMLERLDDDMQRALGGPARLEGERGTVRLDPEPRSERPEPGLGPR